MATLSSRAQHASRGLSQVLWSLQVKVERKSSMVARFPEPCHSWRLQAELLPGGRRLWLVPQGTRRERWEGVSRLGFLLS